MRPLPAGLSGYVQGEQAANQRGMNELAQFGNILGLQQQLAAAPLQHALLQAQVNNATNPPPKWQVSERYNNSTGMKEKVLVDLNNPANVIPFGGQEARNLSFQNTGPSIVGVDPVTGKPVSTLETGLSPHQRFQQETQFPWQQGVDVAKHNADLANIYYNTGMRLPGIGVPGNAPMRQPASTPAGPQLGVPPPRNAPQAAPQQIVPSGAVVPPALSGVLTPKQRAEREADRPKETAALNAVTMNLDLSIKEADKLLDPNSGLGNITGPVMGRTPNVSGSATNAQANLDTLKAQIGVRVLQAMREASKTGGAVGQVTEKEWPILQNQLGALQQSQTTDAFRKNLKDVRDTLNKMKTNAKQSFESVYGTGQSSNDNDPLGIR